MREASRAGVVVGCGTRGVVGCGGWCFVVVQGRCQKGGVVGWLVEEGWGVEVGEVC